MSEWNPEVVLSAETGVLGSMLIDELAVGPMLTALEDSDFIDPKYRMVFQAFRKLYSAGSCTDPIMVRETLGGNSGEFLENLMNLTPSAANADAYAEQLKKSARLHHLRQLGMALNEATDEATCRELIDRANLLLSERSGIRRVDLKQAFADFSARKDGKGDRCRLSWGFGGLDKLLRVGPGDMVVIGGYSSAGKTALALQMAFHIAKTHRVGFFSYETAADKLYDRTLACQSGTSYTRLTENRLEKEDYENIFALRRTLTDPALEFLEACGMGVGDVGACAMAGHYDVIVVDYLQKIPAAKGGKPLGEFERVTQVSDALQQLGRSTGKTIVALSQLSRPLKRTDGAIPPPNMSSLRQSGQIEQDADVVLLLYKERQDYGCTRRCLDIAKNRDGEAGRGLLLDFDGDAQRFRMAVSQPLPERKQEKAAQMNIFRPVIGDEPTPWD